MDNIVKSSGKQEDKSSTVAEMGDRGRNRYGHKSTLGGCVVSSTAPAYLTHQNLIFYISTISKPIHFWFSPQVPAVHAL